MHCHAVYTFKSSPAKREYTVHLEVNGSRELICNIAAMLLAKIQSFVGEKGIMSVET